MTTINSVGNGLSGSTGTGTFVGSNTPTLVTPVLGAATATSINFGGSTLNTYTSTTSYSPVVTFATNGNLSVAYSVQNGAYTQIGNVVYVSIGLTFTPTYTTASGNINISLPINASATSASITFFNSGANTVWPTGATMLVGVTSTSVALIRGLGSATASSSLTTTNYPSGLVHIINISGCYSTT